MFSLPCICGDIMQQKRLVTVQDISCLGKCSLTASIPIIAASGLEPVALPTAVLSTHSGAGFKDFTFKDLTEDMEGIIGHWQKLSLSFDAMYSGYLGSIEQLDIVARFFGEFKTENNLVFIDPVMGDEGRLYHGFDEDFVKKMYSFCSHADIICPNVTEACFLTGIPYKEEHDEEYARHLAFKLADTGAKVIVITGVTLGTKYGALCLDTKTGSIHTHYRSKIPGIYYGTGDIFASVLCSALTLAKPLKEALDMAIDFVHDSIANTQDEREKYYYGVKFEQCLGKITETVKMGI